MPLFDNYIPDSELAQEAGDYSPPLRSAIGLTPQTPGQFPNTDQVPGVSSFGNLTTAVSSNDQQAGGQYTIATAGPNVLVKNPNARNFQDTFAGRQAVRGPYTSAEVGIDHIVPVSLGGTENLTNLQLLPNKEFDTKTLVDNLAPMLYKKGYISLGTARDWDLNWNNKPGSVVGADTLQKAIADPDIPETITMEGKSYDLKGELRRQLAQDITPSVGIKDVWNNLGSAAGTLATNLGNAATSVLKFFPDLANAVLGSPVIGAVKGPEAGKEYFQQAFNQQSPENEALQGGMAQVLGGATAHFLSPTVPTMQEAGLNPNDPLSQDIYKTLGVVGNTAGFVAGMGALGALGEGLPAIGEALPTLSKPFVAAAGVAGKVGEVAGNVLSKLPGASWGKALAAAPLAQSLIKNVALMGAYNQLDLPFAASIQQRGNTLLSSAINAGALTMGGTLADDLAQWKFGPTVKAGELNWANMSAATGLNGFSGYIISRMQGASQKDALTNAGIFMALHGEGYYDNSFNLNSEMEAQKKAGKIFQQYGEAQAPASAAEAKVAFERIENRLTTDYNNGDTDFEHTVASIQQAATAYDAFATAYMPLKQRLTKGLQDIASSAKAIQTENPKQDQADAITQKKEKTNQEGLDFVKQNETLKQQSVATTPTAITSPDLQAVSNLATALPTPGDYRFIGTGVGTLSEDPQAQKETGINNVNTQNVIADANVNGGFDNQHHYLELDPMADYPHAIAIKATIGDGDPLPLGHTPEPDNVNNNQNQFKFEGQQLLNPNITEQLWQKMAENGVSRVEITPHIEYASIGSKSNMPYIVYNIENPDEAFGRAVQIRNTPPAEDQPFIKYNNRQDYFSHVDDSPNKTVANDFFTKAEDLINKGDGDGLVKLLNSYGNLLTPKQAEMFKDNLDNLTYRQLTAPLKAAALDDKLNKNGLEFATQLATFSKEFADSQGQNDRNFWSMPLSQNQPETATQPATTIAPVVTPAMPETSIAPQATPVPATAITPVSAITPEETTPLPVENAPIQETAEELTPDEQQQEAIQDTTAQPVKQSNDFNIFFNKAKVAGERIPTAADYNTFNDNGHLSGVSQRVVNQILTLDAQGVDRNDPQINALYKFYDNLDQTGIRKVANDTSNFSEAKTDDDFVHRLVTQAKKLGIEPFDPLQGLPTNDKPYYDEYDNDQLNHLKRRYEMTKQITPEKQALVLKTSPTGITSKIETVQNIDTDSTYKQWFNNSDLSTKYKAQLVKFQDTDKVLNGAKWTIGSSAGEQTRFVADQMLKNNIFPVFEKDAIVENMNGIYIPPASQKLLLKEYYSDLPKYEINDPAMLDGMKANSGKDDLDDKGKIMQVVNNKIFGNTVIDGPTIQKRNNILNYPGIQWSETTGGIDGKGGMQILFAPPTELRSLVESVFPAGTQNDPNIDKTTAGKFPEDGAIYMMNQDMKDGHFYIGLGDEGSNFKGTISKKLPGGDIFAHKGNTVELDDSMRRAFEKTYNITLKDGQMISFPPNAKMPAGDDFVAKLPSLPENPKIKTLNIQKSDMSWGYERPKGIENQSAGFSLHDLGNFSKGDSAMVNGQNVNISPYLEQLFAPGIEKWKTAMQDFQTGAKSPNDIYKDYTGTSLADVGYGKLATMAQQGGDWYSNGRQIEQNMITNLQDKVLFNSDIQGALLRSVPEPPGGFMDPSTGQYRHLASDELLINKKYIDQWGADYGLTKRDPVTDKLALSKLKLLPAEDYGVDLSDEHVMLNAAEILRKQMDNDGDKISVLKVIPYDKADQMLQNGTPFDGIPEQIADNIEQERTQYITDHGSEPNPELIKVGGKEISIAGAKYSPFPAADIESLINLMSQQADAKQQLGGLSNIKNLVRTAVDNAGTPQANAINTVNGVLYTPQLTPDIRNSIGGMMQAALDATSRETFGQLSPLEKNPLAAIYNVTDPKILKALSKNWNDNYKVALDIYGKDYNSLVDTVNNKGKSTPGMVSDFKKVVATIPQDPAMQSPMQKVLLHFANFDLPAKSDKDAWDSDKYAAEQVKATQAAPEVTPNAQKFIDFYTKQWNAKSQLNQDFKNAEKGSPVKDDLGTKLKDAKKEDVIRNYYYSYADRYSKADKQAISYFLATDKKGNWAADPEFNQTKNKFYNDTNGGFVERIADLILPEQGVPYYQARNNWIHQVKLGLPAGQTYEQAVAAQTPPPQAPADKQPALQDMNLWTGKGYNGMRTLDDTPKTYLIEQAPYTKSRWASLAKEGNEIGWQREKSDNSYTPLVWINGEYYTKTAAANKFLYGKPASPVDAYGNLIKAIKKT